MVRACLAAILKMQRPIVDALHLVKRSAAAVLLGATVPACGRIAFRSGTSRSTVQRAIREAQLLGLIVVQSAGGPVARA